MEEDEFGEIGYAVIDVEALMLGRIKVVEQIACVILSAATGNVVFAEKHFVYQPYDVPGLCAHYGCPLNCVSKSVSIYRQMTGDDPVHMDPMTNPTWSAVRNRLRKILRRRAIKVYAKGAALERTVMGSFLCIQDLEWYGCPKYPEEIHDPLKECLFFSQYIPEIAMNNGQQQQ